MKTARQIAAAKRNLAIARQKRRRGKLAKAQVAKRKFHAKHRRKISSKRMTKRYSEYKKTGLISPNSTVGKPWRVTVHRYKKAGKINKRYSKRLNKHRANVAKARRKAGFR